MRFFLMLVLAVMAVGGLWACQTSGPAGGGGVGAGGSKALGVKDFRVSGPYTHENLTVYLIHGKDQLPGQKYITLTEALEQKKVVVHETQDVNNLQIENISDEAVYVQAGDIVKGGQQDRTFANDCIIAAKSGKMPMEAFCVEQGRWTARAGNSVHMFDSNQDMVAGRAMKMAVQSGKDQSAVWQSVAENQGKLSTNSGGSANSSVSPSSFQLSLEQPAVKKSTDAYLEKLGKLIEGKQDTIGYAVAVNGKISSVDVYANHALFAKLWPKLIKSSAVEALAEYEKGKTYAPVTVAAIRDTMTGAAAGAQKESRKLNDRAQWTANDGEKAMMFRTTDLANPSASLHENYLSK